MAAVLESLVRTESNGAKLTTAFCDTIPNTAAYQAPLLMSNSQLTVKPIIMAIDGHTRKCICSYKCLLMLLAYMYILDPWPAGYTFTFHVLLYRALILCRGPLMLMSPSMQYVDVMSSMVRTGY